MKRIISALSCAVLSCVCFVASAQIGYEVVMPKNQKIVQSTGDNVSLRKSPTTTAPRLMMVCVDETNTR